VPVEARSTDWSKGKEEEEEEEVGYKRKAHHESSSSSSLSSSNSNSKHQKLSNSTSNDTLSHELLRVSSLPFLNRGVHEFHHPVEECIKKDVAAVSELNRSGSSSGNISALNLSSFPSYSDIRVLQGGDSPSSSPAAVDIKISAKKDQTKRAGAVVATPTKTKKSVVKIGVTTTASSPPTSEKKKRVTRSAIKKKLSKMLD
jgi:hypothetical protein